MKKSLFNRFFSVEEGETPQVALLLIMSFFMGSFLATFSVAAQTLFLNSFDEVKDLPEAFMISGLFGVIATFIYNFFQTRVPFRVLGIFTLLLITSVTGIIEFGEGLFQNTDDVYFFGFTMLAPVTLLTLLIFWGSFNRLFNVKQSKRLLGSVDQGMMVASLISFFSIPFALELIGVNDLYTVGLVSISAFTILFIILSGKYAGERWSLRMERANNQKVGLISFFKNKYVLYLSLFLIASMVVFVFIDYSFLNVSTQYFSGSADADERLAKFLSYFEATVVIFGFFFENFAADKVIEDYGIKTSVLINPVLLVIFTAVALGIGLSFGYSVGDSSFIIFFIMIAMSKLFIDVIKNGLDEPSFKLYLLPIESNIKIDVQTKLEGIVTGIATMVAGGLIVLINRVEIFDLIYMTIFAIPLIGFWYFVASKLYGSYRLTLQSTLVKNKAKVVQHVEREYTVDKVLEKEINGTAEDKVIYGLKLMEKLEPALFENAILRLVESENNKIRAFALEKIQSIGIDKEAIKNPEIRSLAIAAQGVVEDSDLLSISPDKLLRLSKSVKPADRMLAAKLLRKMIGPRTIFILLELLRDIDYKVRLEALVTARKVKRPETWSVLIELLSSPTFGHAAASALIEAGEPALPTLETAFHKSGQTDLVMLRIVQIIGRIGGDQAMDLLWKKADYPDKRIVKQILYSLRYINYRATGRQANDVTDLLETEVGKTLWNLAALSELPETEEYALLRSAVREEIKGNYNHITMLMSILYDPEAVQLVRENIESGDPNGIAYAMELMDLFVDQDLKPKLFPIFDDSPISKKLDDLQLFFPRENYTPIQVINYILNRDFNMNNRWTKVCAIYTSAYLPDFRVSRGLIAQMFNSDKLLQESAAWVTYNKNKEIYKTISSRLPDRDRKYMDSAIENNQLLDGLDDGFFLGIEMVLYLKQLPQFKNISGLLLSDLFDKISPLDLIMGERISVDAKAQSSPILIVALGEVKLKNGDDVVTTLKKGSVYGDIFQNGEVPPVTMLEATERSIVFKINLADFYFVMANHHELVEGLIYNITKQSTPQPI
jgi:ATP:ADP antiporter, AAA family